MKISIRILCVVVLLMSACTAKKTPDGLSQQTGSSNKIADAADSGTGEILVGTALSLSGGQASFGTSTKHGIELAISQINAGGGVLGRKIKLIALDDQSKPEEAAMIVTRLITQDKVTALLSDVASSISLAMGPIAQSYKVPMVSPSSTNPKVTEIGDYIFRVCFIDPFQGTVMAKFAFESLKVKRVAILRDIKNDYSMGLADYFIKKFKELGGEVVVDQSYAEGDVDFKSQLTSIKAQNPEAIFVPGYYTEVGLIARQARELGLNVALMGGDGWDSSKLTEIGGAAINGNYFSNHYSPDDPNPVSQKFLEDYKKTFSSVPDSMSVTGYDAMLVLADAIKRAGSTNKQAIRDALAMTKDYPGASGMISINDKRDAVKPAVVLEIKDGRFAFKEKVNP